MTKYPFQLTPATIKIYRYITLLAFLYLIYAGSMFHWSIAIGMYAVNTLLGTTVIHRAITHKAFKISKWLEYTLATITLAGTSSSVLTWVAVHRHHHRFSDQKQDPHSPTHLGYLDVQLMRFKTPPDLKYASELLRDPYYLWAHRWHWLINICVIVVLYFIDPFAIVYAWLAAKFLQSYGGASVNGLNHIKLGYRNFDTKDNSHNNLLTGYLVMGEGWHNNHHNDPANPNFGVKWWEIDLGYLLSKLIQKKTT